jgi:putative exporter of polyketide antibiotics
MSRFAALLRQRLRRDRLQLALWSVGAALLAYLAFVGVAESYGTEQDRSSLLAAALANPVILLFRGLPSGTGEGAFMVFLIFPWLAMLAAFMSTFLAVRHTRMEEESGRTELVAATPAGRLLPVGATAAEGLIANAVLGALVALAYLAVGLPLDGALLVGAAAGAVGVTFLGVGLVAAQLMRTSRGANSLAVWITVGAWLIAGFGNAIGTPNDDLTRMESSWLTWLSPFGWAENTRAFDENLWWPMTMCLGVGLGLVWVALALASVRDVGESFIAERRGRAAASASLSSPMGLVWRLTRGGVLGWAIGGLLTGMLAISLSVVVREVGAENPAVQEILSQIAGGGDVEQATVTVFFTMLGVLAACCAVQVVCRARQEEAHGTAEPVLATSVSRVRWLADYLVIALLAIILVVAAAVGGAALSIAGQGADAELMQDVLVTGGGQAVAASVFLALTALVFVVAPRLTIALGWMLVLLGMMLGLFGPLFGFPEWATNLSPVAVAPKVAGDDIDVAGLWWLVLVTGAGTALSLVLMRRRELAPAG